MFEKPCSQFSSFLTKQKQKQFFLSTSKKKINLKCQMSINNLNRIQIL